MVTIAELLIWNAQPTVSAYCAKRRVSKHHFNGVVAGLIACKAFVEPDWWTREQELQERLRQIEIEASARPRSSGGPPFSIVMMGSLIA